MLSPERMLKQASCAFVAFVESLCVSIKKIGELLIDTFVRFQFPKNSRTPKVLETFGVWKISPTILRKYFNQKMEMILHNQPQIR